MGCVALRSKSRKTERSDRCGPMVMSNQGCYNQPTRASIGALEFYRFTVEVGVGSAGVSPARHERMSVVFGYVEPLQRENEWTTDSPSAS